MKLIYSTDLEKEEIGFWELSGGKERLAMLEELYRDFPWVECFFYPEPEFERYRPLFTRVGNEWRGREKELHDTIAREGITLKNYDGTPLTAFTLVVDGSGARLTFTPV